MKLKDFYGKAIDAGIAADPRPKARIAEILKAEKEKFDGLKQDEKELFDNERLTNPYADSRMLWGNGDTEIRSVMIGIDVDVSEMLLADRLREKGTPVDLVLAHHPEGHAYAGFYDVMKMQADIFNSQGVAIALAESLTDERQGEVRRSVSSANHMKTVDAARLLNIPLMCLHTPADNHVVSFLTKLFAQKKPKCVGDIMKLLRAIPEYKEAAGRNAGPFILSGSETSRCGKILVDMTGGTEGSKDIFGHLASSGVSTLVVMHLSEAHLKKAKECRVNIVNAGHIASDNLGVNLLLDAITGKKSIDVIDVSGFRRVKRVK